METASWYLRYRLAKQVDKGFFSPQERLIFLRACAGILVTINASTIKRLNRFFLVLLSVQEEVFHFYSNLLYRLGHYFLDTQYHLIIQVP